MGMMRREILIGLRAFGGLWLAIVSHYLEKVEDVPWAFLEHVYSVLMFEALHNLHLGLSKRLRFRFVRFCWSEMLYTKEHGSVKEGKAPVIYDGQCARQETHISGAYVIGEAVSSYCVGC